MRITTIPPWYSFTDALAQSLLRNNNPQELADTIILLPNRRACRALREALSRHNQAEAMILPRMMPFADLDEEDIYLSPRWQGISLLPPISTPERHGILMQLILKYGQVTGEKGYGQAFHATQLANELAKLIDQVHWEGLPFEDLHYLVPEDYAQHWQITLDFLKIITDHWPTILKDRGVSDPAAWRRDLILGYAEKWENDSPSHPVIAAGSTGSIPCTARLIQVVHQLPQGKVILPGLDRYISEDAWQQLEITHPQYGLAKLLETLGVQRDEVTVELDEEAIDSASQARAQILSCAMQPAINNNWSMSSSLAEEALVDLSVVDCRNLTEEAGIIALMLREAIEQVGQTAALVTPDRSLVQRVRAELQRWELNPDDSAGDRLIETPEGSFLLLLAAALVESNSIISLLNLLHHPCTNIGYPKQELQILIELLDKTHCRSHRTVSEVIKHAKDEKLLKDLLEIYLQAIQPFQELCQKNVVPIADLMTAHMQAALALGGSLLWQSETGCQVLEFWKRLQGAQRDYPEIAIRDYPAFLQQLMQPESIRQPFGYHPRLFILGPLEARSFKADVMILGGLNEGSWPPLTEADPWLNRPMRADYGLPLPERRIGLSAHDFAQAFCAKRVICTRSLRVNGSPTIPSRWLLRLETVLQASGQVLNKSPQPWLSWYQHLDKPEKIQAFPRPAPCPPVYARPKKLSVTQIETWMRDPYALYARQVLKLLPLSELEMPLTVAEKGTIIHQILEAFVISGEKDLSYLLEQAHQIFKAYEEQPEVMNFWSPRFERIAAWFIETEAIRSQDIVQSFAEKTGSLTIETDAGPFILTAKADRLDLFQDGHVEIIDYKTGVLPTRQEVEQGFSPQLTLESAMVRAGAFVELGSRSVRAAHYWRLRGGEPAGEIYTYPMVADLGERALAGLKTLVETYADASVSYLAQPRAKFALRYNAYAHLTRPQEWMKEGAV